MNARDPQAERLAGLRAKSDAELLHIESMHNTQSSQRAEAILILRERQESRERADFNAVYDQGERSYALNVRVLFWAKFAAWSAVLLGIVGIAVAALH